MLELARPADREVINALAREVHALHVAWRPDIYEMPEKLYSEERFLSAIQNRELYVARLADVTVGYLLLRIRTAEAPGLVKRRVMLVDEICVEETCRNQGIGKEMMADAWALARAFGCSDMQLGVYPQNDEAVSFYQKCGFTIRNINMQRKV